VLRVEFSIVTQPEPQIIADFWMTRIFICSIRAFALYFKASGGRHDHNPALSPLSGSGLPMLT
jgi:hypothetical protein